MKRFTISLSWLSPKDTIVCVQNILCNTVAPRAVLEEDDICKHCHASEACIAVKKAVEDLKSHYYSDDEDLIPIAEKFINSIKGTVQISYEVNET